MTSLQKGRRTTSNLGIVVEEMEGRWHRSDALVQSWASNAVISEFCGYTLWGRAIYGGNGDWGPSAIAVGDAYDEFGWEEVVWDSDLSDGFDSGNVGFEFTADLSGTDAVSFGTQLTGTATGTNTASDQDEILAVTIRAGVRDAMMKFGWGGLELSFYKDGVFQETLTIGDGPTADRLTATTTGSEEEVLTVEVDPSADYDKVVIGGTFRLQAALGQNPEWTDIFGDIVVYGGANS